MIVHDVSVTGSTCELAGLLDSLLSCHEKETTVSTHSRSCVMVLVPLSAEAAPTPC